MPKVLMIAYIFPPAGGSGVQRTARFVRYLPGFGWQPLVLTVSNARLREPDYSLAQELPADLVVYKAPEVNPLAALRHWAGRFFRRRSSPPVADNGPEVSAAPAQPESAGRLRRAWRNFTDTWLQIPDSHCYWFPSALWAGLKIVRQCDVIYSTSAPFTDHLVAWFLHKWSGKPWVADFRDPWTQVVDYQQPSALRSRLDFFLEEHFLKTPAKVVVTCAATATAFRRAHPSVPAEKFIEITNGFDAEDFNQPVGPSFDKFTIVYAGQFYYKKSNSLAFFQALRALRDEHPDLDAEMQVIFAGLFAEQTLALLKQWHLEALVKPVGYVSHQESVRFLLRSHVLLLTLNNEVGVELIYPGKLFEYLAAHKTILALAPPGAATALIQELDAGLVVSPDDVAAIKQAILHLYHSHRQGRLADRTGNLQRFERQALAQKLAQSLDAVRRG